MKGLRGLGLVLGTAAVWALTLSLSRYYAVPFPLNLFTSIAATGLPAFFGAALAYRWRLPQPLVWTIAGYCLGSGISTAVLMGPGEPASRYLLVTLAHAASLTVLAPAQGGGYVPLVGNLVWLLTSVFLGRYGLEAYRGGKGEGMRG
jgi:hypothetical protein